MKHTGNKYRKKIKNNRIKSISVLADLLSDHPDNSLAIIIILLMCTQHIPAGGGGIAFLQVWDLGLQPLPNCTIQSIPQMLSLSLG